MTKFIPKLFKTDMVKAIIRDQKDVTRRLVGIPSDYKPYERYTDNQKKSKYRFYKSYDEYLKVPDIINVDMPCNIGDIIWVRETFFQTEDWMDLSLIAENSSTQFVYKADVEYGDNKHYGVKWKPSLFMPKEACRLFLVVKEVRVSRLHEITKEQCIDEGISSVDDKPILYNNYLFDKDVTWDGYGSIKKTYGFTNPIDSYHSLWDSINGKKSHCCWDANPYVWEIIFEKIEKPNNFI